MNKPFVSIQEEAKILKQDIKKSIQGFINETGITPMINISFTETVFVGCGATVSNDIKIDISIPVAGEDILLKVNNK